MRNAIVVLWMWLGAVTAAIAQVSIGIGMPNVSIGINLPVYPDLVQVPNYPVYYAPRLNTNYFFYDGLYWVYEQDDWYASSWYNGPWGRVAPDGVPLFILRIPVRYYRQPPVYFRGWRPDAPPRWGEHWGGDWQQRRPGWDRWDRRVAPRPAPLPLYQRQYTGERYPRVVERQQALQSQNYRYRPRERIIQQHEQRQPPSQSDQNRQQQRPRQVQQPPPPPQSREQGGAGPGPRDNPPRQEAAPQPRQRNDRDHDRGRGRGEPGDQGDKRDRGDKGDRGDRGDERGRGREK